LPASIDVSQATQDQSKQSLDARLRKSAGLVWLCAIFVIALAVRLWFAFADGHSAIVYSCDASEYFRDAKGLAQLIGSNDSAQAFRDAWQAVLNRTSSEPQLRHGFEPVKELAIAGPIFPIFLLVSHAIFAMPITQLNWQAPVFIQCILTSITCVLIAYIGKSAWNKNVGIAAGVIAALYPGFIVNSIRMYSESFSCFLLCAVVALTIPVLNKNGMFHSVSTGICLAFLQLTRSIMVLVTGLTFAITALFSTGKSRILRLSGLVIGLAIVFAPWLLFQQMAFNKSSVVVDRVGHYNLFIGTNIATNGYLSYPYPDGKGIEKKNYATLVGAQINQSPERFARLMLDKPLRLYKFPWNDFRTPIGPFGIDTQVLFHQFVLALSAIGLTLCLLDRNQIIGKNGIQLRLTLLTLWAMHGVYLIFITVPRYNLTSIPFAILFAAAGLNALAQGLPVRPTDSSVDSERPTLTRTAAGVLCGSLALALLCAHLDWFGSILAPLGATALVSLVVATAVKTITLLLFFVLLYKAASQLAAHTKLSQSLVILTAIVVIPLCAFPLRSNGRYGEMELKSTSSLIGNEGTIAARQTIFLPTAKAESLKNRDCYILVDCENWQAVGNGAKIYVNDIEITSPALPIMPFAQTLWQTKSRGKNAQSEQRYLECEDIYASLTAAAGGGNLDLRQWFALRIPRAIVDATLTLDTPRFAVTVNRNANVPSALYATSTENKDSSVRIPSVARFSWEKAFYGVENESDFTDSRYDDKVAIQPPPASSTTGSIGTSHSKTIPITTPNIRLLIAPPNLSVAEPTAVIATAQGQEKILLKDGQIPVSTPDSVWLATVKGQITSTKQAAENIPVLFSAMFESIDDSGIHYRYRSPWVPTSVVSHLGTTSFQFAFPFQPGGLPGKLTSIAVEAKSGGPASRNDFLSVNNQSRTRIAPGSLGAGHQIDSINLELHNLPSNPIGYGHEVL